LTKVLPKIFGYYIAQIGGPFGNDDILFSSPIHNKIIVNPGDSLTNNTLVIRCKLEDLPFLPESIDAIVMLHILEFTKYPKLILKEIYDSLIPGGYAVILGFNPYSLWGITKFFNQAKTGIWSGNWLKPSQLRRWLLDMEFSLEDYQTFYFRPPSENAKKTSVMEDIGQTFWPYCGASYMFIAKKTSIAVTPIGNTEESFVKSGGTIKALPKPTSRATQCNRN